MLIKRNSLYDSHCLSVKPEYNHEKFWIGTNESSPNYEKNNRKLSVRGKYLLSVRGKNMLFQGLWTLTSFMLHKSWDKVSCILDWPWTCYITEDGLKFLSIIHPSCKVLELKAYQHDQFNVVLGTESRVLCLVGDHTTDCATYTLGFPCFYNFSHKTFTFLVICIV